MNKEWFGNVAWSAMWIWCDKGATFLLHPSPRAYASKPSAATPESTTLAGRSKLVLTNGFGRPAPPATELRGCAGAVKAASW